MADIELVVGYLVARMSGVVDAGPSEAASLLHELVRGRLDGAPAWERAVRDAAGAEPLPNGTRMRLVIALKNTVAQDPEFARELTALAARLGTPPPQVHPGTAPPAPQPTTAARTPHSGPGPAAPPTANRPEPQGGTPPPPAPRQVTVTAADHSVAVAELRGDLHYTLQEAAPGPVEWPLAIGRAPTPEPLALSRDEIGQELAKALAAHRSVLLSGPGGVGKSHLAAAHALRATADGTALLVLWADATDGASLTTSYAHAAWKVLPRRKRTGLEADAEAFLEWFRTPGPSALVVLDNLSDPALLARLLPYSTADDRRVVITARLRGSSTRSKVGAVVEVGPFTPAESLTFLRGRLGAPEHRDPAGEERDGELAELAAELEHLPLALGCAATALTEEGEPISSYLDRLRQRAAGLDDMLPPDPTSGAPAVTAALLLSLDAADRCRPTGAAGPAMRLAGCFEPTGHPERWWQAAPVRELLLRQGAEDFGGVSGQGVGMMAVRRLHEYGLLTHDRRAEPRAVQLPALTAWAARETTPPQLRAAQLACAATSVVGPWPEFDYTDPELEEVLRANAGALRRHFGNRLYEVPDGPAVLTRLARSMAAAGLLREAEQLWKEHTAACTDVLGPDAPDTVEACYWQAETVIAIGLPEAGLALAEAAAERALRTAGPASEAHLQARLIAVRAVAATGQYGAAAELSAALVDAAAAALGPAHKVALAARLAAAEVERLNGRPEAAAAHEQAVLDQAGAPALRSAAGELQVEQSVLITRFTLTGDARAAHVAASRLLKRREHLHGADHPVVAVARTAVAGAAFGCGRYEESLAQATRAAEALSAAVGDRHQLQLEARTVSALALVALGRPADAVTVAAAAHADAVAGSDTGTDGAAVGRPHPAALDCAATLATALVAAGRHVEAVPLQEHVLRARTAQLGATHPATLAALAELAASRRLENRLDEAERMLCETRDAIVAQRGAEHPQALTARHNLALIRSAQGRDAEAAAEVAEVVRLRSELLGATHPHTLTSRQSLAFMRSRTGRMLDCLTETSAVRAAQTAVLGPNHPSTLNSRNNEALALHGCGRTAEAEEALRAVAADAADALGPNHPAALTARSNRTSLLSKLGRHEDALDQARDLVEHAATLGGPTDQLVLMLRTGLARALYEAGLADESLAEHERLLADVEAAFGPDHPRVLTARSDLGNALVQAGRLDRAVETARATLDATIGRYTEDHPESLTAAVNFGAALHAAGRLEQAATVTGAIAEATARVHGPLAPATLLARSNLAVALSGIGRTAEAVALGREVLRHCTELLGERHPGTISAGSNLAAALHQAGEFTEALEVGGSVVAAAEEVLGHEHPQTLGAMLNQAVHLWAADRRPEAVELERHVLGLRVRALGAGHPDTWLARNNLAHSLSARGDWAAAAVLHGLNAEHAAELHGPDHLFVLDSRCHRARALGSTGQAAETLTELAAVVARAVALEVEPANRSNYRLQYALALDEAGRVADALELMREVAAELAARVGAEARKTLTVRSNIAFFLGKLGRPDEALTLQRELLEIHERLHGPEHPDSLAARASLAAVTFQAGRFAAAAALLAPVRAVRLAALGPDDPQVLTLTANLAATRSRAGFAEEAIELEADVLARRAQLLGARHPETLWARSNLAASCRRAGRTAEAVGHARQAHLDALEAFGAGHPTTRQVAVGLADALRADGRAAEAAVLAGAEWSTALAEGAAGGPTAVQACTVLARTAHAEGRPDRVAALVAPALAAAADGLGLDHPDVLLLRHLSALATGSATEVGEVLAALAAALGDRHPSYLEAVRLGGAG